MLVNPQVVSFVELLHQLITSMNVNGVVDIKLSTKTHLRRKLETKFGGTLHFVPDSNGKLLVFPDNLERHELAKENIKLQREIESHQTTATEPDEVLRKATMIGFLLIRQLKKLLTKIPKPQEEHVTSV